MNVAVLRLSGDDSALKIAFEKLDCELSSEWKRGDKRLNGELYKNSGMVLDIADEATPKTLTEKITAFLSTSKKNGICFTGGNLEAELSIGFTVGDSIQFVASLDLPPEVLGLLSEQGIQLNITAYPTSGEANEENAI